MHDVKHSLPPVIELRDVSHSYGDTPSVLGLNLRVHPGEVVCLLGPSGCGKTTALRIAAGLEPVTAGHVLLDGHELSGGQQQRVALARALAPEPHGILMDEPFSGLDARLRESVRDRTLHILKESGAAVLMVTHDAEEAMHMADRIVVMRDGRLEQEGTPDTLYLKPRNGFVAGFFGDVNRIAGTVAQGQAATPLGHFPSGGLQEGTSVEVVIRPEALNLSPVSPDAPAQVKVLASRMLGRTSLIHLCTCEISDQAVHLHARMPGRYLPKEGELQSVHLDRSQVFVFPSEGAT